MTEEYRTRESGATKADIGKTRWSLMPWPALKALAELYTSGAEEYGDRNWEKGLANSDLFDAMCRHAEKWWNGEKYDPKNGCHHLIAVAWNAFALFMNERMGWGTDDRPHHDPNIYAEDPARDRDEEDWNRASRIGLGGYPERETEATKTLPD